MKQERYLYKQQAVSNMVGKYGVVIPALLLIGFVESGLSTMVLISAGNPTLVFGFSVIGFIVGAILLYSTTKMFILTSDNELPVLEEILVIGIKEKPMRSIALQFLVTLFTVLWILLFIIPGIIKAYAYSMSFYLLFRKPELIASEAIDESKKLTDGYKSDLFVLDLMELK